jgi:hypothetical protein
MALAVAATYSLRQSSGFQTRAIAFLALSSQVQIEIWTVSPSNSPRLDFDEISEVLPEHWAP